MRWEQPCEEHGHHGQNYLHYGHGAVLVPVRPQEPPGSARPSPASTGLRPAARAPPAAALGAEHSRLSSVPPPVPPSFCPCMRPSSGCPFPQRSGIEGAACSSCRAGFPCPPAGAAAEPPLPAGGWVLPSTPGRGRRAVCRGKQVPWSCCGRVPQAGATQPAVSPLPRQASSGPPAPPLLPRTSAP